KTLVSDRYFWSAVAYGMADRQGTKYEDNGHVLLAIQGILSMYSQFIMPDITFYLQTSVDTALSRLAKMTKEKELYETREKLEKIYQGYEWLVSQFPKEITVIDGEKTVGEVTGEILNKINK
ncbi:MAG: deoxynucleoside kinase, partial [Candidatus Levybacteria bacterium]|nr:deoxynucleoside kinase [Candidatus Levybacteria bacterium]